MMYGYILHCDGCLADIKLGAKDLEIVSDHTYASSPRYKTEEGASKDALRDAHKWGFEQGWEEAVDSIGHPFGVEQAFGRYLKNR